MATIHSLPTELIRHALCYVYPPGEEGSGEGLCATARVHSTWTRPSVSVLMEKIELRKKDEQSAKKLARCGPRAWSCVSLALEGRSNGDLRAILTKARPGAIRAINLAQYKVPLPENLFALPSLSEVGTVRLATHEVIIWDDCVPWHDPRWRRKPAKPSLSFSTWPNTIKHLTIDSYNLPVNLLRASAQTLTSFAIDINEPLSLASLGTLFGLLPNLTNFKVGLWGCEGPESFALPDELVQFVSSLPRLGTLLLPAFSPQQLEQLLVGLGDTSHVTELHVTILAVGDDEFDDVFPWSAAKYAKWRDEWVPTLRRCAGLGAMGALERWVIRPGRKIWEHKLDEEGWGTVQRIEIERWLGNKQEGWEVVRAEVERAGVELVLRPFEPFERD